MKVNYDARTDTLTVVFHPSAFILDLLNRQDAKENGNATADERRVI